MANKRWKILIKFHYYILKQYKFFQSLVIKFLRKLIKIFYTLFHHNKSVDLSLFKFFS
jgi:hypothetical protein